MVDEAPGASVAALLPRLSSSAPAEATGGALPWIVAAAGRLSRALPIVADVFRAVARSGIGNVFRGTLRIIASLDRYRLFRWVNRLTGNRLPRRR